MQSCKLVKSAQLGGPEAVPGFWRLGLCCWNVWRSGNRVDGCSKDFVSRDGIEQRGEGVEVR